MKDNSYAFIIDCIINKQTGEIIVYELQPLLTSGLGSEIGSPRNAFEKAFPNKSISIEHYEIDIKEGDESIFVKSCEYIRRDESPSEWTHVFTPSKYEISQLDNKVNQRLYLPSEVSPEQMILDLSKNLDKLTDMVVEYFQGKKIEQIVLKHPDRAVGQGNIFFDDLNDRDKIKSSIEELKELPGLTDHKLPLYLLAEEQKVFPRISRKTNELKDGYLTFRMIGIANRDGSLGYFIATKSLSEGTNSHERDSMKRFFGYNHETIDKDNAKNEWRTTYAGPKDKYFNIGEKKIPIKEDTMQKISKAVYHLYHDIKSHTKEEFENHIANLAISHGNGVPFMDPEFKKPEIVERNDFTAFLYARDAGYSSLEDKIKSKIDYKSLDLYTASNMVNNVYGSEFKILLHGIEVQKKFDVLKLICKKHKLSIEELIITAARHGYLNIIKHLIDKTPDQKITELLTIAISHGHINIVKYFLEERGMDNIDLLIREAIFSSYDTIEVVKYLIDKKKFTSLDEQKDYCTKLLSWRSIFSLDIVKYLVEEKGADINGQNAHGDTILHNILSNLNYNDEKRMEIIEYLVAHPAFVKNKTNAKGETALLKHVYYYFVPEAIVIILRSYIENRLTPNSLEVKIIENNAIYSKLQKTPEDSLDHLNIEQQSKEIDRTRT